MCIGPVIEMCRPNFLYRRYHDPERKWLCREYREARSSKVISHFAFRRLSWPIQHDPSHCSTQGLKYQTEIFVGDKRLMILHLNTVYAGGWSVMRVDGGLIDNKHGGEFLHSALEH